MVIRPFPADLTVGNPCLLQHGEQPPLALTSTIKNGEIIFQLTTCHKYLWDSISWGCGHTLPTSDSSRPATKSRMLMNGMRLIRLRRALDRYEGRLNAPRWSYESRTLCERHASQGLGHDHKVMWRRSRYAGELKPLSYKSLETQRVRKLHYESCIYGTYTPYQETSKQERSQLEKHLSKERQLKLLSQINSRISYNFHTAALDSWVLVSTSQCAESTLVWRPWRQLSWLLLECSMIYEETWSATGNDNCRDKYLHTWQS